MKASFILWVAWAIVLLACASPVESLRPPNPKPPARTVFVSVDTWHAMIAFPADGVNALPLTPHRYKEWGYAERAWYLEDRHGLSGIVRALFWPTEGIVEVGHYDRVWADRTPQPPAELFVFHVTDEGDRRLRRYLRGTISVETPIVSVGPSVFYPAVRSYHLFHTCHQYAALALREAGLSLSPIWAFNRTSLVWQLRRAGRIAEYSPDLPLGQLR
jgi:hypothetical protein